MTVVTIFKRKGSLMHLQWCLIDQQHKYWWSSDQPPSPKRVKNS